ncbi:MAG: hypothetical protein PHR20_06435 [Bacteroidales bacterium]|nr:hypothetical protein [Bacteroidales bacterium]
MKKNFLRTIANITKVMLLVAVMVTFTACPNPGPDDPEVVLDGYYLNGEACAFTTVDPDMMMTVTKNEVDQTVRTTLYEKYVALEAGSLFNVTLVEGGTQTVYGGALETVAVSGNDQPTCDVQYGELQVGGSYSVPTSGLYHVVLDTELNKILIIPVPVWDILGGATPLGWTDTPMPIKGDFSKTEMQFEATEIVLREGDYKFRYNGGWKMGIDAFDETATVKVNTNFGGTLDALTPGGENIPFAKADEGYYTINATWTPANGMVFTLTKTGDVEPLPEYPDNLYIIGDAIGGWDWTGDYIVEMVPANGHPYIFWAVIWIDAAENAGFKFCSVKEWNGDFGVEEGDVIAPADYTKGTNNLLAPETSGYYMVVVDFLNNKISVDLPYVYGTGDAFGGYNLQMENALFIDNGDKTMTATTSADGNLRIYAHHKWFAEYTPTLDWWQAEFVIIDGVIEYRGNGNDQTPVPVTAGQIISLNFKEGTGSIQ